MYSDQFMKAQNLLIQQNRAIEHNGFYIGPELNALGQPIGGGYWVYRFGIDYPHGPYPTLEEAKRHADEMVELL